MSGYYRLHKKAQMLYIWFKTPKLFKGTILAKYASSLSC